MNLKIKNNIKVLSTATIDFVYLDLDLDPTTSFQYSKFAKIEVASGCGIEWVKAMFPDAEIEIL